jgi:hypothetical protein
VPSQHGARALAKDVIGVRAQARVEHEVERGDQRGQRDRGADDGAHGEPRAQAEAPPPHVRR